MNSGVLLASTIKTWKTLDEKPKKNGWYDIRVIGHRMYDKQEIVALGLFRDGEWIDIPSKMTGWKEPIKMNDNIRNPAGYDSAAQLNLARKVLEDVSDEFMCAYEDLITYKSFNDCNDVLYRYRQANRLMSDAKIEALSGAKQQDIVKTLCRKVLQRNGVLFENVDETRKRIHREVKGWIDARKKKSKEDIEYYSIVAIRKIRAAVCWGKVHHEEG